MSDKLQYKLEITVSERARIEAIEELLEDSLLGLYDNEDVEAILVKDKTRPIDDDMDGILSVIDSLDSSEIRTAIESVEALADLDES